MGAYSNPAGGGGPPSRGPPTGGLGGPTIGPGAGPGATQMPPTAGDVTVVVQSPRTKIRTTCTTILNVSSTMTSDHFSEIRGLLICLMLK